MTTPLAGITVLDFGQIFQGPYATMLMAKAGADVIKIEPPSGEPLRRRVIATGGDTTLPIAMLNANKRAVTLNLKSEAGKDLLKQMVARADVLLENFSPGTLDGLGVGYDVLKDSQSKAGLCHRHRLRHQRAGSRQSGDGFHHPGRLRHHEYHWRSRWAADEGRSDTGRFHGRYPSVCGGDHSSAATDRHRKGPIG